MSDVEQPHRSDLRVALGLIGLSALAGLAMGLLWWRLAPRPQFLVGDGGATGLLPNSEGAFIAADAVFALVGLVIGSALGAAAAARRARQGVGVMVGLATGGLLGAAVAWALGTSLGGVDLSEAAAAAGTGAVVEGALRITAPGVALTWPIAALVAALALVVSGVGSRRDDNEQASTTDAAEPVAGASSSDEDGAPPQPTASP